MVCNFFTFYFFNTSHQSFLKSFIIHACRCLCVMYNVLAGVLRCGFLCLRSVRELDWDLYVIRMGTAVSALLVRRAAELELGVIQETVSQYLTTEIPGKSATSLFFTFVQLVIQCSFTLNPKLNAFISYNFYASLTYDKIYNGLTLKPLKSVLW